MLTPKGNIYSSPPPRISEIIVEEGTEKVGVTEVADDYRETVSWQSSGQSMAVLV